MKNKIKSIVLILLMFVSAAGIALTVIDAVSENRSISFINEEESAGIPDTEHENGEMSRNEPPSMPDSSSAPDENREEMMRDDHFERGIMQGNIRLTAAHAVLIGVFSIIFSVSFIYFIMSMKNRQFIKNRDKAIIFVLSAALLASYLTAGLCAGTNYILTDNKGIEETQAEKDKADLDKSNSASTQKIDLSAQDTDVTITKGGSYEFSGEFHHSIIVDAADEDVEIVLNNVAVSNEKTAAIIGLSAKSLTVHLSDGSENVLSDGGNSEYDGCIFSNCALIFTGNGKLTVNGNQNEGEGIATEAADITINSGTFVITSNDDGINAGGDGATITVNGGETYVDASGDGIDSNKNAVINGGTLFVMGSDTGGDAGIDTDGGYVINGGYVVALGSDMIELPDDTGRQNTAAFTLDRKMSRDTLVSLMKEDEIIASFIAPKGFQTIIISNDKLAAGDYRLYSEDVSSMENEYGICADGIYTDKNPVSVHNQDTFAVSGAVSHFSGR